MRALERPALPDGEVRILHGERRQRDTRVGRRQIRDELRDRPAVAYDVMQRQRQQMPLVVQPQQPGANERTSREVERLSRPGVNARARLGIPAIRWPCRQVVDRQGQSERRQDALAHLGFRVHEDRPHCFVAFDQRIEGTRERGDVEPAAQLHRSGNVVERTRRIEPMEKRQALLRERERGLVAGLASRNRAGIRSHDPARLQQLVEQAPLLGREDEA